jgi:hypothetical protein
VSDLAGPGAVPDWLAEIPARRLVEEGLTMPIALPPGDRPLVVLDAAVAPGDALVEHLRDPRIDEVQVRASADADAPVSGQRWSPELAIRRRRRGRADLDGELLAPMAGQRNRWRAVTGEHHDAIVSVVGGRVSEIRPGSEIRVEVAGRAFRGAFAAGSPARGRLELATDAYGEVRPGGIDVGKAGSILVAGSRIDAEALIRARAMGIRGIVVGSLPGKELRDYLASERRQQAALHPMPPFGVLVVAGAVRRRIPGPVLALFERLAGREVALLVNPPALVFDEPSLEIPVVDPEWVWIRSGPNAGAEGRVVGRPEPRRFAANVTLEAVPVVLGDEAPFDVPVGDLERFV